MRHLEHPELSLNFRDFEAERWFTKRRVRDRVALECAEKIARFAQSVRFLRRLASTPFRGGGSLCVHGCAQRQQPEANGKTATETCAHERFSLLSHGTGEQQRWVRTPSAATRSQAVRPSQMSERLSVLSQSLLIITDVYLT
jgi:hypothetical protein